MESQHTGKDPDAGKDCGQKNREQKDKIVRQHRILKGHEFEEST